jgi:hypothetical protein
LSSAGRVDVAGTLNLTELPDALSAAAGPIVVGILGGLGLGPGDNVTLRDLADAAVTYWTSAVVANGGTVSGGRSTLLYQLIDGLLSDNLWTKIDRLLLHAAENTQSALIDLVTRSVATAVNSPTFTVDRGYTFNGSTNYLDSNFNPSTAGGAYSLDSASISSYMRTVPTGSTSGTAIGTYVGGVSIGYIYNYAVGGWTYVSINDAFGLQDNVVPTPSFVTLTRTASNLRVEYKNGVSIFSDAQASTSLPTNNYWIGALNNAGSFSNGFVGQIAATVIGGGLTATDAANLSSRINTYMTAIGANVY